MKVEFDYESDTVYFYFVKPNTIKVCHTIELTHNILADFDYQDKLIGIEIMNASSLIGAPDSIKTFEFQNLWED